VCVCVCVCVCVGGGGGGGGAVLKIANLILFIDNFTFSFHVLVTHFTRIYIYLSLANNKVFNCFIAACTSPNSS
jgi:hypothetical protein